MSEEVYVEPGFLSDVKTGVRLKVQDPTEERNSNRMLFDYDLHDTGVDPDSLPFSFRQTSLPLVLSVLFFIPRDKYENVFRSISPSEYILLILAVVNPDLN